jgi:general secretion pathway protein D
VVALCCLVIVALLSFPFGPRPAAAADDTITMNFEDTDIQIVIKFISQLTRKNFIIDEKVRGKVTIISPEKITVQEAYSVFESILEVNGFALVPAGTATKIIPSSEAKQKALETVIGKRDMRRKHADEFVTQVMRLDYTDADELAGLVRPLFSPDGHLVAYRPTNTLIMTDVKSNLSRILSIINELDVKGYHADLYVIPLEYASVATVTDHLNAILEKTAATGVKRPVRRTARTGKTPTPATAAGVSSSAKILADERTNSLIVVATRNDYKIIIRLVEKLDVEAPEGKGRVNIYYLQHVVADEIVADLKEFITGIQPGQRTGQAVARAVPTQTDIKIVANKATNSLIINANPEDYEQIKSVLQKLDIPRSQVLIEALIMEVRGTDTLNLGVEWQAFGGEVGTDNSIDKLGFGGSLTNQGNLVNVIGAINEREIPASLGGGFNLGVFGNFIEVDGLEFPSISALVTAVATRTDTNVLATPQILTTDNEEAEIKVGENRPFLTQSRTGEQGVNDVFQSFDFRDVGLTLKVTPHISQNRVVRLELFQEITRVDEVATEATGATAPVTNKRSADTTVVVQDGHTIVIAGLIQDAVTDTSTKVPCLGDLPVLGYLFKSKSNSNDKTNLMIFLTPHIIANPIEAAELSERKHSEFESYRQYEEKKPDLFFHGREGGVKLQLEEHQGTAPAAEPLHQ